MAVFEKWPDLEIEIKGYFKIFKKMFRKSVIKRSKYKSCLN